MLQSGRSYTPSEIAQELEVSRRTVFRDLNMLELAHIPYHFDKDRGSYRIAEHFFLPPINLTLSEALAMLLLAGKLRAGGGAASARLPLLGEGARAALKLQSVLPQPIRRHVGDMMDHIDVSLGPLASHQGLSAMFNELARAISQRRVCRALYLSLHEGKQLDVELHPLRLMFHGRAWYLIAASPRHNETRTYKLGRIRKLDVTPYTFRRPRSLRLDRVFGDAWGMIPEGRIYDVRLLFDAKVAANVAEVQWHRSQQVLWRDDGSAEFRVRVDGLGEIVWWILGYGQHVRVLAPAALRQRVAASAGAAAAQYAEDR